MIVGVKKCAPNFYFTIQLQLQLNFHCCTSGADALLVESQWPVEMEMENCKPLCLCGKLG